MLGGAATPQMCDCINGCYVINEWKITVEKMDLESCCFGLENYSSLDGSYGTNC